MTLHLVTARTRCLLCRAQTIPGSGSEYCHRPECQYRAERAAAQARAPIRVADLLAIQEQYAHPLHPSYEDRDVPPLSGPSPAEGVCEGRVWGRDRFGHPQVEDVLGDFALYRAERGKLRAFNWSLLVPGVVFALVIGMWLGRGMW